MALNVISNFAANVAHRNLVASDMAASSSLTKLSSGQRVVSAKDDAASLAIGSRLRAEVVAMRTASVNAGQAGSMLQIADGAMATISDILVRMKELAVQSSSGQFSDTERTILDSEFQALLSEVTRISEDTEFNGTQLIAGGSAVYGTDSRAATTSELAGAAVGLEITFDDAAFDTSIVADEDTFRFSYVYTSDSDADLTLTNVNTGDRQTIDIVAALDAAAVTNGAGNDLATGETATIDFANLGVKVIIDENFDRDVSMSTEGAFDITGSIGGYGSGAATVEYATSGITNANITTLLALGSYAAGTGILTIAIAADGTVGGLAGLSYDIDGTATGDNVDAGIVLESGNHTLEVSLTGGPVLFTLDTVAYLGGGGNMTVDIGSMLFGVDYTTTGTTSTFSFKVGTGNETYDSLSFVVNAASATALGLTGEDITSATNAETASTAVSAAIDTLNTSRSDVGAAQNRLTFAAQNLATAIENAEAARSTLLDLDVAKEITVFTSKQVLLQTGIAMLAQANQLPQNLLRLFQ
jgi:flagellin